MKTHLKLQTIVLMDKILILSLIILVPPLGISLFNTGLLSWHWTPRDVVNRTSLQAPPGQLELATWQPAVSLHECVSSPSYCLICSKIVNSLPLTVGMTSCLCCFFSLIINTHVLGAHTLLSSFNKIHWEDARMGFPFLRFPIFFSSILSQLKITFDTTYADILNFWLYG